MLKNIFKPNYYKTNRPQKCTTKQKLKENVLSSLRMKKKLESMSSRVCYAGGDDKTETK